MLIQRGAVKKLLEAGLKGPEKLIKVRPDHLSPGPTHTLILLVTPPLELWL